MSKSLDMLTMLLVLSKKLPGLHFILSFLSRKHGSRIVKRVQKMRQEKVFSSPSLSSFQTLYICAERANLSDIQSSVSLCSPPFILFFSSTSEYLFLFFCTLLRTKFLIDSGFNYCRVVCEANMERLLMIYWVGFFSFHLPLRVFAMQSTIFQ